MVREDSGSKASELIVQVLFHIFEQIYWSTHVSCDVSCPVCPCDSPRAYTLQVAWRLLFDLATGSMLRQGCGRKLHNQPIHLLFHIFEQTYWSTQISCDVGCTVCPRGLVLACKIEMECPLMFKLTTGSMLQHDCGRKFHHQPIRLLIHMFRTDLLFHASSLWCWLSSLPVWLALGIPTQSDITLAVWSRH